MEEKSSETKTRKPRGAISKADMDEMKERLEQIKGMQETRIREASEAQARQGEDIEDLKRRMEDVFARMERHDRDLAEISPTYVMAEKDQAFEKTIMSRLVGVAVLCGAALGIALCALAFAMGA